MSYGAILNQTSLGDIPIGGIILWSGSINNIPKNYSLCNGSNGTPNLTDRFVIGAGDTYDVGSSGGEATHTLTISEMPQHNHANDFSIESDGSHSHSLSLYRPGSSSSYVRAADAKTNSPTVPEGTVRTGSSGTHTHTILGSIENSGNSQPHNNMPPYYALCYIMRVH